MGNKVKRNYKDGLFNAGLIFLIGSMIVSIANYLYHLFMGRMLGPHEYGVLGSLFAIIYISTFATGTFNKVISKYTSELKSKNKLNNLKYLVRKGFYKVSVIGFILLLIYFALTPFLADFMNLDSVTGLVITGIVAYMSLILTLFIGYLNGIQEFVWQNTSNVITTIIKLVLAIIFVYIGYSVNGALFAIIIGSIAGIIICYFPIKKSLKGAIKEKFNTREIYLYTIPVFFASLFPVLLITIDTILVKHYFSSHDAGLYAALGNIGKIIWFGSGFLIGAIFPKIVALKSQKKDTSRLLIKAMFITLFLAGIGCIVYFITPTLIVNTLYGKEYLEIVKLIGLFGIGMAMYSLSQVLITYNLAIEKYKFIYIILAGFIIEMTGIILYHNSLLDITKIFVVTNAIILGLMLVYNINDLFKNGYDK